MNEFKKLIMMTQQEDAPYLCIEVLEDGMQISLSDNGYGDSIEYSFDKLHWNVLPPGMYTPEVNTSTKIYLRGELSPHFALKDNNAGVNTDTDIANSNGIGQFTILKKCNLSGTPCSLIFKDKVSSYPYISGLRCAFARLFKGTPVVNVLNPDFFPIKGLSPYCFYQMFMNCVELEFADLEIPSTENVGAITTGVYYDMFYNCSKLRQGIRRLNHSIGSYCCLDMYYNCSVLERGTDITIENRSGTGAINKMYYMCSNLVNPPIVNTRESEANFAWDSFRNCTSLLKTPIIRGSFTVARNWLYAFMGCKSLKEVWWLPLHAPAQNSNAQWLDNVASEGTVYLNKNIVWNPLEFINGSVIDVEETTDGITTIIQKRITWGFPSKWDIMYCDPDNISDVRFNKNAWLVPKEYTVLQYIESDGSQYIDTGIIPENGCWVIVDSQKTNTNLDSFIFGAAASANGKSSFNINDYTPKTEEGTYRMQTYFRYGQNDEFHSWDWPNDLPFPRKTFFIDSNGFRITSNIGIYREESFTEKDADFSQNKTSIVLFAILRADGSISTSTFTGRIYEYIYGVNTEERMHLIPVRCKADSKLGMYDLVTGQFFVNQGTGEFTYG